MTGGFDLGSVVAHIKADLTDFEAGLNKAKSEANNFGNTMSGIGSGIADLGAKAAVFTTVVAGGFALITKQALDTSAAYEQNRIAFETMLGSADKARALLKQISDFAIATPFELPQLVTASQRLLAYNVEAKDIIPTLTTLGNITAGIGTEKLPQLILAYGQVKAATHLTGMELRQFSEAGVPLLQALVDKANAAGGSWVNVGASAKKSKVDIAEMNDKLAIAKQRLDEANASGKAKKSTLMSLTNTVQNYQQKIDAASGATGKLGKVFVKTKVTAAEMQEKISAGEVTFEQVKEALDGMSGKGGKFFNLMDKQSHTFAGTVSNIKDQIGRLMRSVMGIDAEGDIAKGSLFEKLKQGAEGLLNFLNQVTPSVIAVVNNGINIATQAFNNFMIAIKPLSDWVMANQKLVITFLQGLAVGLGALLIIGTITLLINALINPLTLVVLAVAALYTAWQTNFLGLRDITNAVVTEVINFFTNYLMPAINVFTQYWIRVWPYIADILKGTWEYLIGIIQVAWAIIYGIIKIALALLVGNWGAAWDAVVQMVNTAWGGIKNILMGSLDFIKGWGSWLYDSLTKPFRDAWNTIQELMKKIKEGLDFTKRHSPSVVDIVEKGVGLVNDALGKLDVSVGSVHPTISPAMTATGVSATPGGGGINLVIDLGGAFISDEMSAQRIGEMVGNQIIKKLQGNVRF